MQGYILALKDAKSHKLTMTLTDFDLVLRSHFANKICHGFY